MNLSFGTCRTVVLNFTTNTSCWKLLIVLVVRQFISCVTSFTLMPFLKYLHENQWRMHILTSNVVAKYRLWYLTLISLNKPHAVHACMQIGPVRKLYIPWSCTVCTLSSTIYKLELCIVRSNRPKLNKRSSLQFLPCKHLLAWPCHGMLCSRIDSAANNFLKSS